jgi:hypothetical protein
LKALLALTLALAPGSDLASCQSEVARLRVEGAAAEIERRRRLPPHELFALGAANPAAAAALSPALERILRGDSAAAPAHTLECKTWSCRLMLALSKEEEARAREWQRILQSDAELRERTAGIGFHAGTPSKDPLSGASVTQREVFFTLADPSGKRLPHPRPSERPAPSTAPLPATAEACAAEVRALRAQLQKANEEREAHLSPDERFAKGMPAPKLAGELLAIIRRRFPDAERDGLELECRALVCRAHWPKAPLNWHNVFYGDSDFRRLSEGMMVSQDVYFVMAGTRRGDGLGFLNELVRHFEASRAPADCEARFPARGTLRVKLHLPKTGEPNEQGELGRISATYGDELAGTPLGKCLESAIASSILAAPLPSEPVAGAVHFHRFEFPRKQPGSAGR